MVIDAGGGTIDISSYTVTSPSPLKVEEFHEPKCNHGLILESDLSADRHARLLPGC